MGASKIRLETLVDLVEHRCAASPDATVYTLLDDGVEADRLTCRHLWQRTREVAAGLQQSTTPGERVLLLYPTGLEFVVALFGSAAAELVAVPAPPPDLNRLQRTLPRLMSMIRDSEPTLVLAAPAVIRGLRQLVAETPELAALRWRSLSEVEAAAGDWKRPELAADSLAYLQYTSGSTASPKGVMVSHANLLHNSRSIRDAWRYGPDSIDVSWVPHFHDDGLVHGIVQPLFCGGRSYLMDPMSFVGRPARWLEAISRFRATHSGGPDFAYVLAARKVTEAQRAELDLSSWRLAYNAAEPVRSETLEAFSKAFEPQGFDRRAFFPSFGMAETTLLVSTARWDMPPTTLAIDPAALERDQRVVPETGGRTFVGCGLAVQETDIVIARPETCERCGPDEVGEVWIRGGGVASGYWRNPEATEEAFGGRLSGDLQSGDLQSGDEQSGNGQSVRYLRTGDLGFLRDGELFITGRRKDLIIIRGRNLYPQDIESTAVASHPALRPGCGAAFGVEAGGEERLVVVQEASDRAPLDIDDLAQTVRRKLAEAHDVVLEKLVLIRPRTIPKTSSGKIQRRACRAEYLAGEFEVLAEWQASTSEQPGQVAATQAAGDDSNLDELLAWLRELAGEKIDWYQVDERRTLPPHLVLALGNRGLLGLQAPIADGGLDLGHGALMRVLVQLGAIDLTLATFVVGHNALGLRPVQRYATAELRRRSLPELARGRDLAAFALTEPGAGSHPLAMAAIAEPDGEGWRLRGHKVWSGSAGWAGWINVFARNTDEQGRSHGLIGFVVRPDQPGVRIGAEAATLGLRSMTQNAIHLDGVRVTRQQLLGEPGNGMAVAEDAMLFTRFCLAAVAVGGARRCLQLMLRYASRRTVATGRLLENPVTLHHLRELSAEVEALAALVSATAAALDAGEQVPAEIFAALKIAGPELLWRAVDRAVQLLGGRGYLENNGIARMLRDARVFRIFEGPTETLEMWLGASVLRDAGELDAFLRARLSGAEVADRLRHELERLRESRAELASAGAERLTAQQAVGWRVGAMVVQAALWAASGDRSHAAAAAESRFETAVRQASSLMDEAGSAAVVRSEIAAFSDTIGDIEPMVKPLDLELDALVSRSDGSLPVSHPVPEPVVTPVSLAVGSSARSQEITGWLVDFCSRELGVDAAELEVDRPFASLGLNSVTAVAMADELSERLERRVDRTVAWQYPSIAELALFLAAGEAPSLPASDPAAVAEPLMEPEEADMLRLLAEVEELSDEQAKALLSPESSGMGAVG